jgi:hypothetical protein
MPRTDYTRGDFVTGATHPACAKPVPQRGQFITSGPIIKSAPLPPDLTEFQQAADMADALARPDYAGLEKWAREAQQQLVVLRKRVRR